MSTSKTVRQFGLGTVVILTIAALVVGVVATRVMLGPGGGASGASAGEDSEQLYTCGMHPNVMERGPGICPICNMDLTPLKADDGDAGGGVSKERKVLYWRAPMDPNYVSDQPGKSPMGMDLVPVYADEESSSSRHFVRVDPVTSQNMGIRTTAIRRGPLVKTIRTVGRVDYDERSVTFINTKFEGWIEKLHVDETGQFVDKGQPLFDVYSRELYSAQKEYVAAIDGLERMHQSTLPYAREEQTRLIDAALTKLQFLDVTNEQIEALKQAKTIQKILTIHSPSRGIVTDKMALQGMYVKPGMQLYTIADLTRVWVYVDIYEYQLPWVRVGQTAEMALPYVRGKKFVGTVVYIYPYLEKQTRVVKVRLEFDNPTLDLKPGMFANVTLSADLRRDALLIPREAYIDSGTRQLVFVDRGEGKFEPREIQVGVEAEDGMVEVLYGLDEGEIVVTSGQFMLDAESKLKEAIAKMMEAERALTTKRTPDTEGEEADGEKHDHAAMDAETQQPPMLADAAFACPMEEHPDESDPKEQGAYFSSEAGSCPWCGMNLKPSEELDWVKMRRAAKGADVAYTCVDHQHVFSKISGSCPRCGKELHAFKVMYTCPDPNHAGVISTFEDNCPHCGQGLAAYRGVWLDDAMAQANVPPAPGVADAALYHCTIHPLVHSNKEGNCTICSLPLETAATLAAKPAAIPAGAKYTCPMKVCWQFSDAAGRCSECGMKLKPLEEVAWVQEMQAAMPSGEAEDQYACPMHADERASQTGTCSICGMLLVRSDLLPRPQTAPAKIAAQMNYIMEHYLELQRLLASDRPSGTALHALGLASASEKLAEQLNDPDVDLPQAVVEAATQLRHAAVKITAKDLQADRVTLVELSAAVRTLVGHVRPDRTRWPKLFIYHCPLSKGDWIQATEGKANPYYGFKMLKCGELQEVK
ncbi:MAG: efflux RND transporter periplasmic adaptor subunit [Planctomycetes bacterium]|nr:efflux RND transporter periplasmic adaptor subunit [Planctomycetota bacterium]